MIEVVADASFSGAWFLPNESSERADALLEGIAKGAIELLQPDLWSYEMVNLLVVACRRGRLTEQMLAESMDLLNAIPCAFHDHHSRLARQRVAQFCRRFVLSAYDAAYLELADRFQVPLYSLDQTLNEAARSMGLNPAE